ncbi:hypothetical protein, partial [Microcoleus sp.]
RGWFETLSYRFEPYQISEDNYFEWIINVLLLRLFRALKCDRTDSV